MGDLGEPEFFLDVSGLIEIAELVESLLKVFRLTEHDGRNLLNEFFLGFREWGWFRCFLHFEISRSIITPCVERNSGDGREIVDLKGEIYLNWV